MFYDNFLTCFFYARLDEQDEEGLEELGKLWTSFLVEKDWGDRLGAALEEYKSLQSPPTPSGKGKASEGGSGNRHENSQMNESHLLDPNLGEVESDAETGEGKFGIFDDKMDKMVNSEFFEGLAEIFRQGMIENERFEPADFQKRNLGGLGEQGSGAFKRSQEEIAVCKRFGLAMMAMTMHLSHIFLRPVDEILKAANLRHLTLHKETHRELCLTAYATMSRESPHAGQIRMPLRIEDRAD